MDPALVNSILLILIGIIAAVILHADSDIEQVWLVLGEVCDEAVKTRPDMLAHNYKTPPYFSPGWMKHP